MTIKRLKVGIQLPEAEREFRWTEIAAMVQLTEESGFDSIWVGDHLIYRVPGEAPRAPWEAWSQLAALAAITNRVEIGPLVACTGFQNPAILAKKAATIDEISNGRLILGLGAGWHEPEYDAYGLPYDHRASRFEEAFTIIRLLLREGYAELQGNYYSANDCYLVPRGPRPAGPPLMIGSFGDRLLRATLPYVDAWNCWYADFGNSVEGFSVLNDKVTGVCEEVGRNPAEVERTAAILVACSGATGRTSAEPSERAIAAASSDPVNLAALLKAYQAAGVDHIQLVLDPITCASIAEVAITLALI